MRRIWDEGFREITSGDQADQYAGGSARVSRSAYHRARSSLSFFQDLGAAPVTINLAELYTALQTKVFGWAGKPARHHRDSERLFEVQKYCSMTDHMWVGYWILVNGAYWNSMPAEFQQVVADAFDDQAPAQRTASAALNNSLRATLEGEGLVFNVPDKTPFRETLVASGFYKEWQGKFDPALWSALEQYTGQLS